MLRAKTYRRARFVQTLYEYDGPKLILLKTPGTSYIIAVAIVNEEFDEPFYGAEVTLDQLHCLLEQEYSVRYLFLKPKYKMRFILDLADLDDGPDVKLIETPLSPATVEYLPGRTFFADDFTEEVTLGREIVSRAEERILVDGNWEISDFGDLYGGYSDLYSFTDGVKKFESQITSLEDKREIMGAFQKQWQGGGSYGSFYRTMRKAQSPSERLGLGGFEYHSPGFVDLEGRSDLLKAVTAMLRNFEAEQAEIAKGYKALYNYLQANKLLSMKAADFDKDTPLAKSVAVQGAEFSAMLPNAPWGTILRLSGNDPLVAAKVVLSLYRRLSRLNDFQLQGRVTFQAT
ncbi:MAG: hypothetical protein MH112_01275 [Phenylobacterium sp.]|uniref:hypothetical protein n=1 Tax=Phenylobacterium sp. TaxID=1871053 RepID=UPI0025E86669|nr:hypothetical protein [Phenylobacterium sp.]MCG9914977.1 hypothetical protein [Phenylobacterium sp.]